MLGAFDSLERFCNPRGRSKTDDFVRIADDNGAG